MTVGSDAQVIELHAIRERKRRDAGARAGGGFTAHERIDLLLDEGSFTHPEPSRRHRITGRGTVHGRTVFVHATTDLVCLGDGTGIRAGASAPARMSGLTPRISVIRGPWAGGATYSPASTEFVFLVRGNGADVRAETSGACHFAYDDEETCLLDVRHLLTMLPADDRPAAAADLVSLRGRRSRDVRAVIEELVDDGDYLEVQPRWATGVVCVVARLGGGVVGIVAGHPACHAGAVEVDKVARFVRTCGAFSIPLVDLAVAG